VEAIELDATAEVIQVLVSAATQFQEHHTNQSCYKSGTISPEYQRWYRLILIELVSIASNPVQDYAKLINDRQGQG
jgi:hypothetical protein